MRLDRLVSHIMYHELLGRKIETPVDSDQQAGNHQITWNGHNRSSETYFYRVRADDYRETKKMLLLK